LIHDPALHPSTASRPAPEYTTPRDGLRSGPEKLDTWLRGKVHTREKSTMVKRRISTQGFKARVVLEMLIEHKCAAQLSREHGIKERSCIQTLDTLDIKYKYITI
jgi:hypothetical protein